MSSDNNNFQAIQTSTDEATNQLLPQFQMMLNTALDQQAAKYENTMKQMAEELKLFRMNSTQPPPAAGVSATGNTQDKTLATSQSKGKKPNLPSSVSAKKPDPPQNRRAEPDPPQTQRAEAVATTLRKLPSSTKIGPRGSLKNASPSTSKRATHQMMLEDYPDDFLDTKECLFTHIQLLWGIIEVSTSPPPANLEFFQQLGTTSFTLMKPTFTTCTIIWPKMVFDAGDPTLRKVPKAFSTQLVKFLLSTPFDKCRLLVDTSMNFNHKYIKNMARFINRYNHYVHHLSSKKNRAHVSRRNSSCHLMILVTNFYFPQLFDSRYKFAARMSSLNRTPYILSISTRALSIRPKNIGLASLTITGLLSCNLSLTSQLSCTRAKQEPNSWSSVATPSARSVPPSFYRCLGLPQYPHTHKKRDSRNIGL
ncbi:uncharacterized protein VP01_1010g8 [Puccinia sorghi]|uniref:Uncharacterized protein n=1 Tax=Puccinia sorghi TaxID=27349 RepID=A0A0L6VV22_9BASI|nr:uncharacterized protein VP01_1010g8 [Puccinia sorghi]